MELDERGLTAGTDDAVEGATAGAGTYVPDGPDCPDHTDGVLRS
jgi:hypothetical protein